MPCAIHAIAQQWQLNGSWFYVSFAIIRAPAQGPRAGKILGTSAAAYQQLEGWLELGW